MNINEMTWMCVIKSERTLRLHLIPVNLCINNNLKQKTVPFIRKLFCFFHLCKLCLKLLNLYRNVWKICPQIGKTTWLMKIKKAKKYFDEFNQLFFQWKDNDLLFSNPMQPNALQVLLGNWSSKAKKIWNFPIEAHYKVWVTLVLNIYIYINGCHFVNFYPICFILGLKRS